jgi:hypothetical protein
MYVGWAVMDWCKLKFSLGKNCICSRQCHVAAMSVPHGSHVSAKCQPRQRQVAAMSAPRGSHVSTMWLPRQCHVFKHHRHVICHIIATSSAKSSLQVMWQVNPWRSLSSHILGFGLGSLGFTPIYDGLKTSWITSIHDENVNRSREVICDAQSMTKWKFITDAVLWRK